MNGDDYYSESCFGCGAEANGVLLSMTVSTPRGRV
jgi:hypothetical protein